MKRIIKRLRKLKKLHIQCESKHTVKVLTKAIEELKIEQLKQEQCEN